MKADVFQKLIIRKKLPIFLNFRLNLPFRACMCADFFIILHAFLNIRSQTIAMKHILYKTLAISFWLLAVSVPANADFSLTHQTGIYDALQENGMQSVHTDYQILYAKPGESVHLYRPERSTFAGYVRWYCYDTDRAVPAWYTAEESPVTDKTTGLPIAAPRIQSLWAKDTVAATLKFKAKNDYGWFGYTLIGGSGKATKGDENYVELKYTMHNGDSIYRIACDQGIWNDYSPTTWNNNATMTEPTLSKRIIFEIRPASWMADSLELCKDMDGTNDRYLEEHELIAPTGRQLYIGPNHMCLGSGTGNKIALKQYTYYALTNYYYINSQSNVTAAGDKSKWKWYVDGVYSKSGFSTKSSQNSAQFIEFSSSTPGTVVYTLKYNSADGVYFNVARFKVTYMDVDVVGPSTNIPAPTKKMERIYEETFNYDEPNTTDFAFWSGHYDVDESTYGYYNKSMDLTTSTSKRQTEKGKITWCEYAVTNRKSVWVSSGETAPQVYQHVDSTDNIAENAKKGYMLYCDGSQQPGQVFNLKVDADLCPGSTMYFSAWVCDASSTGSNNSAPNLDFIVTGIDAGGKEHPLTTFTTGEFGINAVKKVGESAKMERAKWYQIMFPVKFETETTYPSYRLRIRNKSTSSDGNDFAIDDIRIYVQKPPVMPIQASTSDCIDKAVDSVRAYLRIDYQEIDDAVDHLYYQWREENRIIRNAYYNKDSASTTFGCISILSTDEEIAASGMTSPNLLAFDAAFRETEVPVYRYINEQVSPGVYRYVLYVAQPIEVSMNHNYTGFVATHHESLGSREGCGTYADMIVAGGTRIIIEDHTTLGDSVVTMCGHRTYTLNIVLIQIIQDESDPDDPLKSDTTFCRADWLIGDSTYINEHTSEYGNLNFDQIEQALQLYRSNPESSAKTIIENLKEEGLFIPDTSAITMQPSVSLSYTAFPLAGSAGSKQVCTSPRFLHIRPSTEIATMMAVGNSGEVLPPRVANRPRVVRISNAQKKRGSFRLPLYLKGEDNDDVYDIERIVLESSTNPTWDTVELDFNKVRLANTDEIVLSGSGLTSLEAGYDYTFHIVFQGEETEHVGCERGRTYFTLRIVPDVVTWLGGNWNVDFNWSPFIPLEETDVVLLPQNYNVTFGDTIYDFGYQKNHCKDIYLPAGMSMAGQENLNIHGQVYIDLPLCTHKWNLTSIPLQGVVSGDIFSSTNESTNPFEVADIDHSGTGTTAADRYGFEIYQSPYDVHHDKWHVPTNTLTRELHPTEAYMIGVATDPESPADTAIVRLPKPGSHYHYYDFFTHKWLDEYEDIVRNPNYGKPAWNGEPTISLREVYGNVYLLGNPTFGHINIKKLVEDNTDKLTGRYTMPEPTDVEPTRAEMTVFTHKVDTMEDEVLLPPLKGILLEGKGEPSSELVISISAKDITEPGFVPKKANVAPLRAKKHASSFNDGGGIPTGAIKSIEAPVKIDEWSMTIDEELDPYHEGEIAVLNLRRELYRDGAYNTICLPFDLSAEEIAVGPLTGAKLYNFVQAEKVSEAQLDIIVSETDHIDAGIPYLIKWNKTEPEVIDTPLVFYDVHIEDIEGQTIGASNEVQFVGSIPRKLMVYEDHNNLFVGANNILYWPNTHNPLRGFRAYFLIPEEGPAGVPKNTPARIIERHETATGMEQMTNDKLPITKKIIRDNQLFIFRDGKCYTVFGQEVK